jgi:hypothetical protein
MPHSLNSIKRRAANNSLEVEHLLEAAALRLEGLPALLDKLAASEEWNETGILEDGSRVVPLARWARVASAYCREGLLGLENILALPGHESFVLAMLQELHSAEAVGAIGHWFAEIIANPANNHELAHEIASTLNLILCFPPDVDLTEQNVHLFRQFAHALAGFGKDQVQRAVPVLLLRAIGDESSLALMQSLPPFTSPWESVIPATRRSILKRLKAKK